MTALSIFVIFPIFHFVKGKLRCHFNENYSPKLCESPKKKISGKNKH